jgi:hypothetical protein
MDEDRALQGIRQLLPEKTQREKALVLIRKLLKLGGAISEEKEARLLKASHILELNLPVTAP